MSSINRLQILVLAGAAMLLPKAAWACEVKPKVTTSAGPYSPAAVSAGKVPPVNGQAGFACADTVLTLFGGNYIRATFSTANALAGVLKLKNGAKEIPYTAFADAGSTVAFTQGKQIDYVQNNLLNLLGLLGSSSVALPLYIKPGAAAAPTAGDYTDKITINWDWQICSVAYALGACVGSLDKGSGTTEIAVTVTVGPQDMTIALTSVTTWDPVNGTGRPLATPGSKGRTTLTVGNPDLVPLDGGSIRLIYKVPAKTSVALDGDGSGSPTVVGFADGSPASGTALTYTNGASAADDVDFSADDGNTWGYAPVPGNRASEAAVTHLRFRPRNPMAARGSFTLSFPYLVR
jgi:hypothetical protein